MFVYLLGQVTVKPVGGVPIAAPGAVASGVLAALALDVGHNVSVETLTRAVWDDPPVSAKNAIQVAISKLRKLLPPETIVATADGYRLAETVGVDALKLERSVAYGTRLDASDTLRVTQGGLAVCSGTPLAGLESRWAHGHRERLSALARECRLLHAQALNELGRTSEAVGVLAAAADESHLDGRFTLVSMTVLAKLGRRAEALRAYEHHRVALADELGIDPSSEVQDAFLALLGARDAPPAPHPQQVRLPRLTGPTFGRDVDRERVTELFLRGHNVVTLLGIGGMGKTRLAVAVAADIAAATGDSVWFVDLSAVNSAIGVHATTASVLGDEIESVLAAGRHLIVLDNAEHVFAGVTEVLERLLAAGDVNVLVTSRIPLGVAGEEPYWLTELHGGSVESPAVQLLVERSQTWTHVADEAPEVFTRLAQHADGVPLALELTAAAMRWRSPHELLESLDDELRRRSIPALGDRQNSVVAAIEWNLAQASFESRTALGALLVFAGSFAMEAAEHVVAAAIAGDARAAIAELCDLSLVQRIAGSDSVRLRILEPIRIAATGNALIQVASDAAVGAHADWYVHTLDQAVAALDDSVSAVTAYRARDEQNLAAALEYYWTDTSDAALVALANAMRYWFHHADDVRLELCWQRLRESASEVVFNSPAGVKCIIILRAWHSERGLDVPEFGDEALVHVEEIDPTWRRLWVIAESLRLCNENQPDAAAAVLDTAPEPIGLHARFLLELERVRVATQGGSDTFADGLERLLPEIIATTDSELIVRAASSAAYYRLTRNDLDRAAELISLTAAWAEKCQVPLDAMLEVVNPAWLQLALGNAAAAFDLVRTAQASAPADPASVADLTLIAALALDELGHTELADAACGELRAVLDTASDGIFDAWSSAQAHALLARYSAKGHPAGVA